MQTLTTLSKLLLVLLISTVVLVMNGDIKAQAKEGETTVGKSSSLTQAKVDSVLGSRQFVNALLAQNWEAVVTELSRDSTYRSDARAWLLAGHAHLARNSNNFACAVFFTILDSTSLSAWENWTAAFVSKNPRAAVAHYLYGDALARNGELDKAVVEFTEALKIDPTSYLAANARGVAFAMKWLATEGQGAELFGRAAVDFETAMQLKPNCADAHANKGALMIQGGHAKVVNEEYAKAIKADSNFALAYNGRACALAKLDSLDKARDQLVLADSLLSGIPFVALNAKVLASTDDTLSRIAKIAARVPRGTTYDSLTRGSIYSPPSLSPVSSTHNWNIGIELNFGIAKFNWDYGRGGVFFDGIRVSQTGKPQKVGTDFMLAYPRGGSSAIEGTERR